MMPTLRSAPFAPMLAVFVALAGCGRAPESTAPTAPVAKAEPAAVARPSKHYAIEDFIDTTGISGVSFSPDESEILFSSNRSGVWNAYTMPVGGGEWTPVTQSSTDNVNAVGWFPGDARKLVTRDQGGNELNHLYVIETDGSERDLTPGDKLKAAFAGFNHAGDAFYVQTNERDPRFFDLYRYSTKDYARERLFENTEGWDIGPLSADERWLALGKTRTTNDNDLHLHDRQENKHIHLSPHEGDARWSATAFSPDSTHLLYLSNEGSEYFGLRRYDIEAGTHARVQDEPWDIAYAAYSHNGKYRVSAINDDGSTRVSLVEVASGAPVALPTLPSGEIRGLAIARSERRMAFYVNGDRQPNELYTLEFGQPEAVRLTTSLSAKLDAADLVDSSVVRFNSFDGMEIPNILWKPHQATAGAKAPALVLVHGGPGGQTTRGYNVIAQYLANHGYVVLGINNRGSSGYGRPSSPPMTAGTAANRCGTASRRRSTCNRWTTSTRTASASWAAATAAT